MREFVRTAEPFHVMQARAHARGEFYETADAAMVEQTTASFSDPRARDAFLDEYGKEQAKWEKLAADKAAGTLSLEQLHDHAQHMEAFHDFKAARAWAKDLAPSQQAAFLAEFNRFARQMREDAKLQGRW